MTAKLKSDIDNKTKKQPLEVKISRGFACDRKSKHSYG